MGNNCIPIGSGLVATTTTAGGTAFNQVLSISRGSLILPGLFSAASAENVIPVDRVFFDYGYFNAFRVPNSAGTTPAIGGFNLNSFYIGVEKTLLDGRSSVFIKLPFLEATDNSTGYPIDGVGDLGLGAKFLFLTDYETGTGVSGGLSVYVPTTRDEDFRTTNNLSTGTTTTRITNPIFLQPWIGGIYVGDRFFVQEYLGVIIPTDHDLAATSINNDVTLGYTLYRTSSGQFLSSVTPLLDIQTFIPVSRAGAPNIPAGTVPGVTDLGPGGLSAQYGFSYELSMCPGIQLGLGSRTLLSTNLIVPVLGPRTFNVGASIGLSWLF